MPKTIALPRLVGAAVFSLALAATIALPASALAEPIAASGPPLVVTPSPAGLPKTTVGNQSQSVQFDLFNQGEEEAAIETIAIDGEDGAAFGVSGSSCGTLFAGQHCQVGIYFQPGSVGEKHATARILFSGGRVEESFALSGIGVPPNLTFNPGGHDFGIQPVNSEQQRMNFQVENSGEAGVKVGGPEFAGGYNGFWLGNSDCSGRWMEPGETCSVEVGFGPNSLGAYSTQLRVNANGENFSARLSGEGGQAVIEALPNPADFGAVTVGGAGSTRTITLSNSGNVGAGFFIAVVSGGDAGSFHLLEENCTASRLQPGSSCTAKVRFTPLSSGQATARLSFFGEGDGGMQVVLNGEGVLPAATLLPAVYNFGSQPLGSKSPSHSFALRNEGSTPLDLDNVAIVGADLDQFALAADECTGASLAPGAECLVRVRFAPDAAGAKTAILRVRPEAGTFTAALTGQGYAQQPPAAGGPSTAATGGAAGSHPGHYRGRHRRFSHGDAVASARGRALRRADLRANAVPR